ncbi:MAG: molybdate ABC transporter substrate-binding protein [Caldilineaceae bacterium]
MRLVTLRISAFLVLLLIGMMGLSACRPVAPAATAPQAAAPAQLTVYVPGTFVEISKLLGAGFEAQHPDVKVKFEVGHTPTQRAQIEQGATPDVLIAAGHADMDALAQGNLVASDQVKGLTGNKLVVIVPPDNAAQIASPADIANPGVRLLIAAEELPVGMATQKLLDNLAKSGAPDFKEKALANVVSKEMGVNPIVSKISLGEADAGIVFVTDVTPAANVKALEIPDDANVTLAFVVAPLAVAPNPELAKTFVDYLLSDEGQSMLQAKGFLPAKP